MLRCLLQPSTRHDEGSLCFLDRWVLRILDGLRPGFVSEVAIHPPCICASPLVGLCVSCNPLSVTCTHSPLSVTGGTTLSCYIPSPVTVLLPGEAFSSSPLESVSALVTSPGAFVQLLLNQLNHQFHLSAVRCPLHLTNLRGKPRTHVLTLGVSPPASSALPHMPAHRTHTSTTYRSNVPIIFATAQPSLTAAAAYITVPQPVPSSLQPSTIADVLPSCSIIALSSSLRISCVSRTAFSKSYRIPARAFSMHQRRMHHCLQPPLLLKKVRRPSPCDCAGFTAYSRCFNPVPRDPPFPGLHQSFHGFDFRISRFQKISRTHTPWQPLAIKSKYLVHQFYWS